MTTIDPQELIDLGYRRKNICQACLAERQGTPLDMGNRKDKGQRKLDAYIKGRKGCSCQGCTFDRDSGSRCIGYESKKS